MITQKRLKEMLRYDPKSGNFYWRKSPERHSKKGMVAGFLCDGYIRIGIDGRVYRAHRLAFLYMTGRFPLKMGDHRNRNRSDNSWKNLRDVSRSKNMANGAMYSSNRSGVKGVYKNKRHNKWVVHIRKDKKLHHFGYFVDFEKACAIHRREHKRLHGE